MEMGIFLDLQFGDWGVELHKKTNECVTLQNAPDLKLGVYGTFEGKHAGKAPHFCRQSRSW